MLLNVGGGSPTTGEVAGIHWHMNIANEIDYISTDEQRQVIPWVRIKDGQGNVTEYQDRDSRLTAEQIATASSAEWTAWIVTIAPRTFISARCSSGPIVCGRKTGSVTSVSEATVDCVIEQGLQNGR